MRTTVDRLSWPLLLVYAFSNAALYSMLLPLWEGFDEPFHFGYAQGLASGKGLPDPRESRLSKEIALSLELAPASIAVKNNLPAVTTYADFFALSLDERRARHRRLFEINPNLREEASEYLNYEGLQAPLAYAVLAIPEALLARTPLPYRVLALRALCACTGSWLLLLAARRLAVRLGLSSPYVKVLLFCALSSQMIWATMAHVANDWLAVPLALWLLLSVMSYDEIGTVRNLVVCALVLSFGLLTKAYFIAFLPLPVCVSVVRGRSRQLWVGVLIVLVMAGPWYYRNLIRYNTVSGMQELRDGANPAAALAAVEPGSVVHVIDSDLRQALWTGNNTFRSFSVLTLRMLILAWLSGLVIWVRGSHAAPEWIIIGFAFLFFAALAYNSAISFVAAHSSSPSPWYAQAIMVPMLALALLGANRKPKIGRWIGAVLLFLFGYIIVITYWGKLIPLYAGITDRLRAVDLLNVYKNLPALLSSLGNVSLVPPKWIIAVTCFVTVLSAVQAAIILRCLLRPTVR